MRRRRRTRKSVTWMLQRVMCEYASLQKGLGPCWPDQGLCDAAARARAALAMGTGSVRPLLHAGCLRVQSESGTQAPAPQT